MSVMTEQMILSVWFFIKSLKAWKSASKTKGMEDLLRLWDVINAKKSKYLLDFAKIPFFKWQ